MILDNMSTHKTKLVHRVSGRAPEPWRGSCGSTSTPTQGVQGPSDGSTPPRGASLTRPLLQGQSSSTPKGGMGAVMDPTRRNTKFGMLAFDDCPRVDLAGPVVIGNGVSVHPRCPIELEDHWRTWLGTFQAETLTGANLVFTVQIESATPTILDAETKQLNEHLLALRVGLFLHGIPEYKNNLIALGGIDNEGVSNVRRIEIPARAFRHSCGRRPTITAESLASTSTCANHILELHRNQGTHRRVRAGFRACTRGMEEPAVEERLHQFVRAIDGLTMLLPGEGRRIFAQRARLFAAGASMANVLVQLYQLRNAQEHLNDFRADLGDLTEAEMLRLGSQRAYQAEQVALEAYRRLFTTPALLARLESDANIGAFWALDDNARRIEWGAACDLDAAQTQHDAAYPLLAGIPQVVR